MDKYQKFSIGIAFVLFSIFFMYNITLYFGDTRLSLESLSFPFYIFLPGWVAIFLPLIARQRREAKMREEELRSNSEEQ